MTRLVAGMVLCLIAGCVNISAQTRTPGTAAWEVEFNVGGAFITTPKDGAGSVPGGTRLTNVGVEMWQVPSWYFGDGAALLTRFPLPLTTPLDSVLLGRIAQRERTATYGLRAARRVTNRLRVEGSVDFSGGSREASASTRAALEASRASFVEYWRRFPAISVASLNSSVHGRRSLRRRRALGGRPAVGHPRRCSRPCLRVGCLHRVGYNPVVGAGRQRVDRGGQSWLDDGHPIRNVIIDRTTHAEWSCGARRAHVRSRRTGTSREGNGWSDVALLTSAGREG